MNARTRRGAVVVTAAVAVCGVATAAVAYYGVTSTSSNAAVTVATLARAGSPAAAVTNATTVAVSWTIPGGQLPGATYAVVNTTDGHQVCTVATNACTDTAALPGAVNAYTVTTALPGTSWTTAATAFATPAPTPDALAVTGSTGAALTTVTAGTAFGVRVTARKWNGTAVVTDTTYAGTKTVAWSGLSASPNGNIPVYPATSVAFTAGASTTALNVTTYAAGAATLAVAEGPRSGGATFTVAPAGAVLRFTSATPSCASGSISISASGGTFGAKVSRDTDAYGNTVALSGTPAITLSGSPASKGSFSPSSVTYAAGAAESPAFTWTASGANPSVVLTAAAAGFTAATCTAKQS